MAASTMVIGSSEQAILVRVRHDLLECTFGFIHAASDHINRRDIWHFISSFHCSNLCLVELWDFIEKEELFEVEAVGANFTWASRRSDHGPIVSKLDRILAHDSFIGHWDSVSASVLARAGSDHHPLMLHCLRGTPFQSRPFKFQVACTMDDRFRDLVCDSWSRPLHSPDPIVRVIQKLKRLKGELRIWNKQVFGLIST
ncbi:hypothetical protein ACS0TY_025967 [Phlomoides rotata]